MSKLGQKRERRGPNNQPLIVGKKEKMRTHNQPHVLPSCLTSLLPYFSRMPPLILASKNLITSTMLLPLPYPMFK